MTRPPLSDEEKKARRESIALDKEIASLQIIASHSQSMAKHALVVQMFGGYIVNFFAYMNTAIFSAFTVYMTTDIGLVARKEHPWICFTVFLLSTSGLFFSLGLMASVTHYSRNKFNHYRNVLSKNESTDSELFKSISIAIVTVLIAVTIFGAAFSTGLFLTTEPPAAPPAKVSAKTIGDGIK